MNGSRQPITEMERWLLGLGAIRGQASDQIDDEIDKTAISGVFDLRNVLQLVIAIFGTMVPLFKVNYIYS